ncbi:MAG: ATP-binding protein [Candidatus Goldbacteria bacterium]|nr:ATP-binding protein [Candidatus Goldiibacteriota bacterium]
MPNIPEIKPEDLIELLNVLDKMENPPALMVFGPPGVGKTRILKKFADEKGYELRVKHLSRMDQTDWSGIPKENEGYTGFLPVSLFKPAENNKRIVIFFDELNTAHPGVLNAALDIILEKKGDTETFGAKAELPENTIIVAAGNLGPDEDGTYVEELSMAVKTRLIQVRLNTDISQWIRWANKNNIHERVIEFIDNYGASYLLDLEEFKERNDQAATPRGWERVSDFLKTIENEINDLKQRIKILENFVYGVIGKKKGEAFVDYYRKLTQGFEEWENNINKYKDLFEKDKLLSDINRVIEFFELINIGLEKKFKNAQKFAEEFVLKVLKREANSLIINALSKKTYKDILDYLEKNHPDVYYKFTKR